MPPPSPGRRRGLVVVLAAAVALVVAVAAVLALTVGRDDDDPQPAADDPGEEQTDPADPDDPDEPDDPDDPDDPDEPEFQDWLAPARTLTYGRERYVSPCQVLNLEDAEEIFGDLPPDGRIDEETYDTSPPLAKPYPVELLTRCDYEGLAELEVEQYASVDELTRLGLGSASLAAGSADDVQPHLARYQAAARLTDDEELKTFIGGIIRAGRAVIRYDRDYDDRAMRGLRFADVVVPVGPGALSLRFFQRNIAYTIGEAGGLSPEIDAMSDEDVLDRLSQLKDAIERVRERAADPQLSQSGAPTITGESDRYEDSYVLEPCAVLTRDVFRATTGRKANDVLRRSTLPPEDRDAPGSARTAASEISISNTCERNHRTEKKDLSGTNVSIRFAIRYAPSPAALQESMRVEGFTPLKAKDRKLRTPADFAAFYPFEPGGNQGTYLFTVDSYLLEVSIDVLLSDGGLGGDIVQGQSDVATHERLIRNLVPALRRHLAEVEAASPTG